MWGEHEYMAPTNPATHGQLSQPRSGHFMFDHLPSLTQRSAIFVTRLQLLP